MSQALRFRGERSKVESVITEELRELLAVSVEGRGLDHPQVINKRWRQSLAKRDRDYSQNERRPVLMLSELSSAVRQSGETIQSAVLQDLSLLASFYFEMLDGQSDPDVLLDFATADCTPPIALLVLATSRRVKVKVALAQHWNLSMDLEDQLVRDRSPQVREAFASNPMVGEELIACLADDPVSSVRWQVANRAFLPSYLHAPLSFDSNSDVLESLGDREDIEWTGELSARFVHSYNVEFYEQYTKDLDLDALASLLGNWERSLDDLVEATSLIDR